MLKKLKNRIEKARKQFHQFKNGVRRAREEQQDINKALKDRRKRRADLKKEIRKRKEEGTSYNQLEEKLAEVEAAIKSLKKQKRRVLDKKNHRLDKLAWWTKRKTILRRKIKKAKKKAEENGGNPVFESWMANGYNWQGSNQGARNFVARAVVLYDCYCTSMKRDYVPPGGSTTSFHLQGKASDIGGARMQEFQEDEYNKWKGNGYCLELFGPNNSTNLKNGGQYYMPEGSGIEQLHDTHAHGAFAS